MKKDFRKSSLMSLRCRIAGVGESIRFIKRQDRKIKDKSTSSLQWQKLLLKKDARLLNLAYGLLRGISYKKMESKVSDENNFQKHGVGQLNYLLEIINKEIFSTKDKWTLEELKKEVQ